MKTKQEIIDELPNFYGTEAYHRWSALFRTFVLSDGAQYVANACGAYWLMDAIASHRASYKEDTFVVAHLFKFDHGWKLQILDGNGKTYATQNIEFSDFPLETVKLYIVKQGDLLVIMLPSEY